MNCVAKRMNVTDDVDNNKTERNLSNALPNATYIDWMLVYACVCISHVHRHIQRAMRRHLMSIERDVYDVAQVTISLYLLRKVFRICIIIYISIYYNAQS